MTSLLCISIRFLHPSPVYHGIRDGGEPEWPPSPLRLFQALVSSATHRWRDTQFEAYPKLALEWLQAQGAPAIIAPSHAVGTTFRIAVPNNDLDVVASAWSKGAEPKKGPSELKTMKSVLPVHLRGANECENVIRFLYRVPDGACPHFEVLQAAARSVTHLGWGIDMVAGNAELLTDEQAAALPGEVWRATTDQSGTTLRVSTEGTLNALLEKHQNFLGRLTDGGFKPVPPLTTFRVVGYRRATEPPQRQFAAFSILKPDASGLKSFDPLRRTRDVAGMVRHAAAEAARDQGWTDEQINVFVHGKSLDGAQPSSGANSPDRFQYLPLPTINPLRVDSIRRVLIVAPPHCNQKITWARRAMAGVELINDNKQPEALLTILPGSDNVLQQYTGKSTTWSTVTPVILPGYDDPDHLRRKLKNGVDAETQKRYLQKLDARIDGLLRKAFLQAGYSSELVAQIKLEWRDVGFRAGVELASRYLPPENLNKSPRYQVRVTFPLNIIGPIAVGGGRFRGFGLFAIHKD